MTRDELAAAVEELLQEWRSTCKIMGISWTDRDAAAFIADALAGHVSAVSA